MKYSIVKEIKYSKIFMTFLLSCAVCYVVHVAAEDANKKTKFVHWKFVVAPRPIRVAGRNKKKVNILSSIKNDCSWHEWLSFFFSVGTWQYTIWMTYHNSSQGFNWICCLMATDRSNFYWQFGDDDYDSNIGLGFIFESMSSIETMSMKGKVS